MESEKTSRSAPPSSGSGPELNLVLSKYGEWRCLVEQLKRLFACFTPETEVV